MLSASSPQSSRKPSEPAIQSGVCYVLFAYDAARSINLDEAERRMEILEWVIIILIAASIGLELVRSVP